MTATLYIGDVRKVLATLDPGSVDLFLSSPPFLAVRSYLPAEHPDKPYEIGSEATPADYLDTLLDVVEACARVLAPHGSLVFELGDTYAGSGGAGGDYNDGGLREGQAIFSGTASKAARSAAAYRNPAVDGGALRDRSVDEALGVRPARKRIKGQHPGWPLDKSLCGIPTLFAWSLAYGRNLLRPERTTDPWRIRTLKAWIRTNPPVGALGDKERPATSYIVVATKARDRWFDLDAVRTQAQDYSPRNGAHVRVGIPGRQDQVSNAADEDGHRIMANPAGAPPLDWWCHVDAVLDQELARSKGNPSAPVPGGLYMEKGNPNRGDKGASDFEGRNGTTTGAHLRRALQTAGILQLEEAIDQSPGGYSGAHYAVWPPELAALLLKEMCPRQVCRVCGQPRRRIVETDRTIAYPPAKHADVGRGVVGRARPYGEEGHTERTTLGWSDCGHDNWRPGLVADPFAGSGTTLDVATSHGYDSIGIDLDERSADLARGRCGMFLTVEDLRGHPNLSHLYETEDAKIAALLAAIAAEDADDDEVPA
jgi:hypothetical protein